MRTRSSGSLFAGKCRYLQTGVECQFFQDVVHVALDGKGGNVKGFGDFFVAQAFRNQVDDLTFPMRKLDGVGGYFFAVA